MRQLRVITLIATIVALPYTSAAAQSGENGDIYKLLATTRTGTMQKELDEASEQGYRILVGSPTAGTEMALFLQHVAKPPETYKYKLLATTRTGTMEKEINEAAEGGFRLMPSTMIAKKQLLGSTEIVLLMERPPMPDKQYQYKLLATTRTGTLQKEAADAQAAGFVIIGMVSRGEHMVVMEKETLLRK